MKKTTEGTEENLILIRLFSVLSVFSVVKYRFFHTFQEPEFGMVLHKTLRNERSR